ncbi:anti-sigma factor domain-containing protein [Pseudalkalibacillus caeni]|uniref:Anti-sigma factor domain-containing protein n=1 Tax=Exobacillus caeni TaxID=2574798 RepID=A0A5R9F8D8_9BACL|nr:anti-sigma factor domain-containing protein [Pseudalkalibacillus caeni]TLS38789.1 anti-sigma factor domain-containing protein [Pseudalkalibacillus caeni]
MKRGVVMEVNRRKAIILTPEGSFREIKMKRKEQLAVGDELEHSYIAESPKPRRRSFMPTVAGLAAALLFFVVVSGLLPFSSNEAVAAYVNFDINPSIEVGVNSELEVVQLHTWNTDAERLKLDLEAVKEMPLSNFTKVFIQRLDENGYLSDGRNLLIVTTAEDVDKYKDIQDELQKSVASKEAVEQLKTRGVATTIVDSDAKIREKAIKKGISPGKYTVYLDAVDKGYAFTEDAPKEMSYGEMKSSMVDQDKQKAVAEEETEKEKKADVPEKENTLVEEQVKPAAASEELEDNLKHLNNHTNNGKAAPFIENKSKENKPAANEKKDPPGQLKQKENNKDKKKDKLKHKEHGKQKGKDKGNKGQNKEKHQGNGKGNKKD